MGDNKIQHEALLTFVENSPKELLVKLINQVERENDVQFNELIESLRILVG